MLDVLKLGFKQIAFGGGDSGGSGGGDSGSSRAPTSSPRPQPRPTPPPDFGRDRDDSPAPAPAPAKVVKAQAPAPAPAPAPRPAPAAAPRPAPVATPAPAPASLAPTTSIRPVFRPTTITLPTTDPDTGTRGTADISFQEYAALPRDDEGFIDLGSQEAQLLNLDVQKPADYGTPEGFALEDQLYFGEDSLRSRMQEPPTGIERLFRGTTLGAVLGPMADRQEQVVYNQLVQGPNYRGTPITPTGNFLYDSAAGFFGDRSFDQDAANYVAVTENGQIIGSLAVDAAGNPIGYRGTQSAGAQVMDPSIDAAAAASFIRPQEAAQGEDATEVVPETVLDPCPVGYTFNPATQTCELDEVAEQIVQPTQPQQPVVLPQVPTEVTPTTGYTPVAGIPTLAPLSPQAAFTVARAPVRPISLPAPTGLASLRV